MHLLLTLDVVIAGLWQLNFSKFLCSSVTWESNIPIMWLVYKLNEVP